MSKALYISIAAAIVIAIIVVIIYFTQSSETPDSTKSVAVINIDPDPEIKPDQFPESNDIDLTPPPPKTISPEIAKTLAETYGFTTTCNSDKCSFGGELIEYPRGACRNIGGSWTTPGDDDNEYVNCRLRMELNPTHGFAPPGTCGPIARVPMFNDTCSAMGGTRDPQYTVDGNFPCNLSICPINKSTHTICPAGILDKTGNASIRTQSQEHCDYIGGFSSNCTSDGWCDCYIGINKVPDVLRS